MSYASATAAQRLAMNSTAEQLAAATQGARAGGNLPALNGHINPDTVAAACASAIAAAGIGLIATQVVVSNGATVNVENSAGALDSPGTATVAAGVLTDVKLAATKTILTNAAPVSGVTVTGSGTTFTPTIVDGVLVAAVLS